MWQKSEFCNQFYRSYFVLIVQEIFAVLTDTFHKPGFKLHVLVLQHLFCLVLFIILSWIYIFFKKLTKRRILLIWRVEILYNDNFQVESGSLTEPLWDASTVPYPYPNNGIFVREYTIKLLCGSFPNISASEVEGCL